MSTAMVLPSPALRFTVIKKIMSVVCGLEAVLEEEGILNTNETCARRRWEAYLAAALHRCHEFCPRRAVFVSSCV